MTSLVAIGAGIAALTGIGAGIGIGLATSKAVGSNCKTAGGREQDQQKPSSWMCPCRRYCNFRFCSRTSDCGYAGLTLCYLDRKAGTDDDSN